MLKSARTAAVTGLVLSVLAVPASADTPLAQDRFASVPPTTPHVGFYTVHPRVGLSTYFSLSASWPHTQNPLHVVAKVHPAGVTCGTHPASDSGELLGTAWLTRANHHTVWKEWTPTASGSYTVCTWLGDPAIATGAGSLVVAPASVGATPVGTLVSAATSKTADGSPRAVFPYSSRPHLRPFRPPRCPAGATRDDRLPRHEWPRRRLPCPLARRRPQLVQRSCLASAPPPAARILARDGSCRQERARKHPLPRSKLSRPVSAGEGRPRPLLA